LTRGYEKREHRWKEKNKKRRLLLIASLQGVPVRTGGKKSVVEGVIKKGRLEGVKVTKL